MRTAASALAIAAVAWGALAFGAVYTWAYVPLAAACAAAGALGLAASRRSRLAVWPAAALALVALAIGLQAVPVPRALLARISPAAWQVLPQFDLAFAAGVAGSHALSLSPEKTLIALALLLALGVFLFGLAAALDEPAVVRIVQAVLVVGVVAALVALVQRAAGATEIYGFWQPQDAGTHPFGPFVNRNHFAGWMLMAWPVGVGFFVGRLAEWAGELRRKQRSVAASLSSPRAGELLLVAFALVIMAVSALLSMSRSGILCLALGTAIFGATAIRRLGAGWGRAVVILYLALMTAASVGAIGMGGIESRLDEFSERGFGDRTAVWADSWRVARAYPVAGTGLNTFGTAMLFYQTRRMDVIFDEAHNDYLQLLVEGGVLVAVPAVLFVALTAVEIRRRMRERRGSVTMQWIRAGAAIGLVLMALQEWGEFSLQMPGNAALFCVVAAIALHTSR
jgi:O-antigen ligase